MHITTNVTLSDRQALIALFSQLDICTLSEDLPDGCICLEFGSKFNKTKNGYNTVILQIDWNKDDQLSKIKLWKNKHRIGIGQESEVIQTVDIDNEKNTTNS